MNKREWEKARKRKNSIFGGKRIFATKAEQKAMSNVPAIFWTIVLLIVVPLLALL